MDREPSCGQCFDSTEIDRAVHSCLVDEYGRWAVGGGRGEDKDGDLSRMQKYPVVIISWAFPDFLGDFDQGRSDSRSLGQT